MRVERERETVTDNANDSGDFTAGKIHGFFDHFLCLITFWHGGIIVQAVEETAIGDDSLCEKDVQPVCGFGWMAG